MTLLPLLPLAFLATVVGTWGYRAFAIRRGIVANPNFRSLPERPIPRGGGLVFSLCIAPHIEPSFVPTWIVGITGADEPEDRRAQVLRVADPGVSRRSIG